MSEQMYAVSVIEEAGKVYYDNFENVHPIAKKQLSLHALDQVFRNMVTPAIDKARALDRDGHVSSDNSKVNAALIEENKRQAEWIAEARELLVKSKHPSSSPYDDWSFRRDALLEGDMGIPTSEGG